MHCTCMVPCVHTYPGFACTRRRCCVQVAQELALEKANDLYDPKATQATKPDVTV